MLIDALDLLAPFLILITHRKGFLKVFDRDTFHWPLLTLQSIMNVRVSQYSGPAIITIPIRGPYFRLVIWIFSWKLKAKKTHTQELKTKKLKNFPHKNLKYCQIFTILMYKFSKRSKFLDIFNLSCQYFPKSCPKLKNFLKTQGKFKKTSIFRQIH